MSSTVHISQHPLIAHKLSLLRDRRTRPKQVRELLKEIGVILGIEATRYLPLESKGHIEGYFGMFQGVKIQPRVGLVPILRAGLGFVDGVLELLPHAQVLHLGLYREKSTLQPVEYYNKLPSECTVDMCIVLDPMIATAGTALATIGILRDWGVAKIAFIAAVASRQGLDTIHKTFPDVSLFVGAVDDTLNENGYVVPGFGDAGDRQFKTIH